VFAAANAWRAVSIDVAPKIKVAIENAIAILFTIIITAPLSLLLLLSSLRKLRSSLEIV